MTTVVNIYKEPYDQYIGRAGRGQDGYFGNPYPLLTECVRGATLKAFKEYFDKRIEGDPEFKRRVHELQGKRLGCFCKPKACHGDIIAEYLNSLPGLKLEQFLDEWYITEEDLLYGKIRDMGRDNYFLLWLDEEVKIPLHGFDNVERYVKKHYKEHKPI